MERANRTAWLREGLRTLAEHGLGGLTIEAVAGSLRLTKGSFYHHFRNMAEFEAELLAFWSGQYLGTGGDLPADPRARLRLLDALMADAFGPMTAPEIPIRMWAAHDPRARAAVEAVDAHRRRMVLELVRGVATDPGHAELMADTLATMAIGSLTMQPRLPTDRVLALYREFKRVHGLPDH